MIYLDTHVAIWLYAGKLDLISPNARQAMEDEPELLISPMVLLELDFLYEIERIRVDSDRIGTYLNQKIGLAVCDKSFELVCKTAAKQQWTRDPFDRLITAQAAIASNGLITKDRIIHEYYPQALW
ncbi:PIN domain-containing protein [uncultured Desulfosarcina sp.]|uniref:type II toxin-antitoxin system VapC family toxin n=1 Tax=uncultured Desulfosarcina sp. TaxID=218289 RepID=UPI0029C922C2|nr:PIN domain-containing protein [uncultured Desulfosarcina sp.]